MNIHDTLIGAAYDAGIDEEDARHASSPLAEREFILVCETVNACTPAGGIVIDIGCGPGRYAEYLLQRNFNVGVVDLSGRSLERLRRRAGDTPRLLFSRKDCATFLGWIPDRCCDTVLLMGPLYHLTGETDRTDAIANCRRILKPGGIIIAMFLATDTAAAFPFTGKIGEYGLPAKRDASFTTTVEFAGYRLPQFRCTPAHARRLIARNGFTVTSIRNIEEIATALDPERREKALRPHFRESLFTLLDETDSLEQLLGYTNQFLIVGKKTFQNMGFSGRPFK
jgi:SAM-dependent methyltransferase